MLYGFRKDYQEELVERGYNMCVYVPFGTDWYAYFMRTSCRKTSKLKLSSKISHYNKNVKIGASVLAGAASALWNLKIIKEINR